MATPFEQFFKELDGLTDLVDNGPEVNDDGSTDVNSFLDGIRSYLNRLDHIVLTPTDVENEFTDEENEDDGRESGASEHGASAFS